MPNPNIIDTAATRAAVDRYVRAIRNAEKRRYAEAYRASIFGDGPGPVDSKFKLSVMGAQAVRIAIGLMVAPPRPADVYRP